MILFLLKLKLTLTNKQNLIMSQLQQLKTTTKQINKFSKTINYKYIVK